MSFLRPFSRLAADKWKILFLQLPNSTIQRTKMFKKFYGKTFLINRYKLLSERKKNNIFKHLKWTKYLAATTQIILDQIMKFPDFSPTFLVFKNSLTSLQNSLTFPWSWRKIKLPRLFPDQRPLCLLKTSIWILIWGISRAVKHNFQP